MKASAGHAALVPSQVSATSQSPAAARHTVPALPAGCWQRALLPSQVSVVHGLPSSVHAVPLGSLVSAGQVALATVQVSSRSHSPAAARHTVPAGLMACAGHVALVPLHVSATSQSPA